MWMELLNEWQTLIGAILGGVIALWAALIVANSQIKKERRSASIIIASDLTSVMGAAAGLREQRERDQIAEDAYPSWVASKLSWARPRLSSVFDAELVRLIDVHTSLAAHLTLFKTIYSGVEDALSRIEEDHEQLGTRGLRTAPRNPKATDADARTVARGMHLANLHATFAVHYISELVLAKTPTFNRVRMAFLKGNTERQSDELLRKGAV